MAHQIALDNVGNRVAMSLPRLRDQDYTPTVEVIMVIIAPRGRMQLHKIAPYHIEKGIMTQQLAIRAFMEQHRRD